MNLPPELLNQILQALATGAVLGLGALGAVLLRRALRLARFEARKTPSKEDDKVVARLDEALTAAGLPQDKE